MFLSFALFSSVSHAALYDQLVKKMNGLAKAHPDLVSSFTLGKNDGGAPILGLKIQKSSKATRTQLVVGTHHGNEPVSADVAMQFAEDVAAQMQNPSEGAFGKFADEIFYVIPVLNIPGYNADDRYETNAKSQSVDPNRDYPDPCGNPETFKLASTKALADFMKAQNIDAAITIHGYIGTFTFPWGIYTDHPRSEDDNVFAFLAAQSVKENGYETGTHAEVIYPTVGAFEDWAYHELGAWVALLEISNTANIENDARALLRYFSLVPDTRSTHHAHIGHCQTHNRADVRSRP